MVDDRLDPATHGLEEGECDERGRRHRQRLALHDLAEDGLESNDRDDEHRPEDPRDKSPTDRPADEPVDLVEAISGHGDPMAIGSASPSA